MAWTTITEVFDITKVTVTDSDIAVAMPVIDLHSGRTEDTKSSLWARDLHWLKLATAYQAVWMKGQPDVLTRSDATRFSQDQVDIELKPTAISIAPLAKKALKRLTWKRNRSVTVQSQFLSVERRPDMTEKIFDLDENESDFANISVEDWEPI